MPNYTGGLTTDGKKLTEFLNDAAGKRLEVGFFPDSKYPDGTSVASIARKNEYGVLKQQQPPRPFMRPAVENIKREAPGLVADLSAASLDGQVKFADVFNNLGLFSVNEVMKAIEDVTEPELAPRTLRGRRKRGNSSTKPLEDTMVMKSSVDFEVSSE